MPEGATKIGAREALLSSAEQLFTRKGYASVGTREIAELAGVNLGAIQYHFGSKAQLFIETVRYLMSQREEKNKFLYSFCSEDQSEALIEYCSLIQLLMYDICVPEGPNPCRLMFREVHGATAENPELFEPLVSLVVDEFFAPFDNRLRSLIKVLQPDAREETLALLAQSVIAQCSFYFTHRPFIERLRKVNLSETSTLEQIIDHVCRFTLSGMGFSEKRINESIKKNWSKNNE